MAQVFATPFHYCKVVPSERKSQAHEALDDFFHQVGIPQVIISDNAKEQVEGKFRKKCRRAQ